MSPAHRITFSAAALACALFAAAPALAQETAVPATAAAAPSTTPGPTASAITAPTAEQTTAGVRRVHESAHPADAQIQDSQRTSRPVALMLVGGAGLIVGSVIGGDAGTIVMVTSGVILLVGLYRFLR